MRRTAEQRDTLTAIIDEALETYHGDVADAAAELLDELLSLRAGGIGWANAELTRAALAGLKVMVRDRRSRQRVGVGDKAMPAHYTIDGESVPWLHAPIRDLGSPVRRLTSDATSRFERAGVLDDAQELAAKHNVETAAEAFAAEGITVTELAS